MKYEIGKIFTIGGQFSRTYFRKTFENIRKYSLRTPKIKKISLKTPIIKKKNKKKIGLNAKNLIKLEPQQEQTFLIKKNKCI